MNNKLDILNKNLRRVASLTQDNNVQWEKYPVESKSIKELVSEEVLDLLKTYKCYLAGGAITSIFTGSEVNDLDVYFRSEKALLMAMAEVLGSVGLNDIGQFSLIFNNLSTRTIMLKDGATGQEIQFMTFKYFKHPDEIFNTFDFTCCMGCYSFEDDGFYLHKDFLKHNSQKYLKFNAGTAYPIMSLLRVDKYRGKGYEISKPEMLRIIFKCMDLGITTWEEAIDHMAGMYGFDMSEVFDQEKEFSYESLITQLDDIQERDIQMYQTHNPESLDFWGIVEKVAQLPELPSETPDPMFDTSNYWYKCVDSKLQSPLSSDKLTYTVGSIIEDKHGIYVHKDPTQPYHNTLNWVELELIEGLVDEKNHWHYSSSKECKLIGKIKVVRSFTHLHLESKQEIKGKLFTKYPDFDKFLNEEEPIPF